MSADESTLVRREADGETTVLTLDYQARRNALSPELKRQLAAALEAAEGDAQCRAVVLTGAGGQFCAGGDLDSMNVESLADGRARMAANHALLRLFARSTKPLVAAVEGWCAGGGIGLMLCCDTIVAAEGARFVASFPKVGLIPDFGLLHTLPLRVGEGAARQMMLYAEAVDAARAERIGLVDLVVANGTALDAALARARAFRALAPLSTALTRQYLFRGLDAALDWEREVQAGLFMSADHAEGKAAFFEKRAARFQGR